MELALVLGWAITTISLDIVILLQGKSKDKEISKLLDRIQAPAAVEQKVTYEELASLPTVEHPRFENDEDWNAMKEAQADERVYGN